MHTTTTPRAPRGPRRALALRLGLAALACGALAALAAPAAHALGKGDSVLARWKVDEDIYHYPATVVGLDGDMVDLQYADGTKGRMPRPAVVARGFLPGDFVKADGKSAVVQRDGGAKVTVVDLKGGAPFDVPRAKMMALIRTDLELGGTAPAPTDGAEVMAKWDQRSWYWGKVNRVQGQAVLVHFADDSWKWVPHDHTAPWPPPGGIWVEGINKRDGQPVPAKVVEVKGKTVKFRFFGGEERTLGYEQFSALIDQPGIDYDALLERSAPAPESDTRPHAKTLYGWLTPALHYYADDHAKDSPTATSPVHLELVFCLWAPSDRPVRADWKRCLELMAEQTRVFLARELGVPVDARACERPVVTDKPLAWYLDKKNLDENAAWRVWAPTGDSAKAAFPDGPKAGRHRVVVVLPDAPGVSADSSGFERGMGYVRLKGTWWSDLTVAGLEAVGRAAPPAGFDEWKPDYLSTTIAHEVLHTVGFPHTDGNPWEVMNIGPWYPITRREVHIGRIHKLAMRSPFTRSLSLTQGFAQYLLDPGASYLKTIAATPRADTRLRITYAKGPGLFKLREVLGSFGPGTVCRGGDRKFTGDRTLCRAYLASFVAFLLEKHGPPALQALFGATEADAADVAARHLKTTVPDLERGWHEWLRAKTGVGTGAPVPAGAGAGGY